MPKVFGRVITAAPVPWTLKRLPLGVILKGGPPWMANPAGLSLPQLKACLALARAATGLYGTKGKLPYKGVSMPAIAVRVAAAVSKGAKVHGGLTVAERARAAHEVAGTRISALESLLTQKGA